MDVTTLALAKKSAKQYTDETIQGLGKGIIYKGAVDYYNDLPNNAELGDCYSVLYTGTSGEEPSNAEYVWGKKANATNPEWIKLGEDVPIIQYDTMPEVTAENNGKIVQYVGETSNDYVNGYFYQSIMATGPEYHDLTLEEATRGITQVHFPSEVYCPRQEMLGEINLYDNDNVNNGLHMYSSCGGISVYMSIRVEGQGDYLYTYSLQDEETGRYLLLGEGGEEVYNDFEFTNTISSSHSSGQWDDLLSRFVQIPRESSKWKQINVQLESPQYSFLPEITAENNGKIIQYIGETNSEYTKGYFYQSQYNSPDSYHPLTEKEAKKGISKIYLPEVLNIPFISTQYDNLYLYDESGGLYLTVSSDSGGEYFFINIKNSYDSEELYYTYTSESVDSGPYILSQNEELCQEGVAINFEGNISTEYSPGSWDALAAKVVQVVGGPSEWKLLEVQPAPTMDNYYTKTEIDNFLAEDFTKYVQVTANNTQIVLDELQYRTIYTTKNTNSYTVKIKGSASNASTIDFNLTKCAYLLASKDYEKASNGDIVLIQFFYDGYEGDSYSLGYVQNITNIYTKDTTQSAGIKKQIIKDASLIQNILTTAVVPTIDKLWTFNTLPVTSITATTNNQLTNKQYVDGAISTAISEIPEIQCSQMPPASGSYAGRTIQYVGPTIPGITGITEAQARAGIHSFILPTTFTCPSSLVVFGEEAKFYGEDEQYIDIEPDSEGGFFLSLRVNEGEGLHIFYQSDGADNYTITDPSLAGSYTADENLVLSGDWRDFLPYIILQESSSGAYVSNYFYHCDYTLGDLTEEEATNGISSVTLPESITFTTPPIADWGSFVGDENNYIEIRADESSGYYYIMIHLKNNTLNDINYGSFDGLNYNILTDPYHAPAGRYTFTVPITLTTEWENYYGPVLQQEACQWNRVDVQPSSNMSNYYTKAEIDELLRNLSS